MTPAALANQVVNLALWLLTVILGAPNEPAVGCCVSASRLRKEPHIATHVYHAMFMQAARPSRLLPRRKSFTFRMPHAMLRAQA